MSKRKWLREQWETYRLVIPRDASREQVDGTEQAFYAGAAATFALMTDMPKGADELGMEKLQDIGKEIHEFGEEYTRKRGVRINLGSA